MLQNKIYFKQILIEWLEEKKTQVKNSSFEKYKTLIEVNINPILGNINFKKMKPEDIYFFLITKI